jgi:hypothetical protein
MKLPDYSNAAAILDDTGAEASPAELHGVVVGFLCSGIEDPIFRLMENLYPSGERNAGSQRLDELLAQLNETSRADLLSGQLAFRLLLPDDDDDDRLRVEALAQWCEGFLHGLGRSQLASDTPLPDDIRELLQDFAELTRAGVDEDAEGEEVDAALMEIVEFVRVGVQTIFEGMGSGRLGRAPGRLH